MQKNIKLIVSGIFLFLFLFSLVSDTANAQYMLKEFAGKAGYSTTGVSASVTDSAQRIINIGLSVVGYIFFAVALYAGIRWLTAMGNEEHVTKAREALQAAVIGMAIVAMSYAVTNLVFKSLSSNPNVIPIENSIQEKLPGGEVCVIPADCASGVCTAGKCGFEAGKCLSEKDCSEGQCINGTCVAATQSQGCNPPCGSGFYCDPLNKCQAGCVKNEQCEAGKFCSPMNTCEFVSNVGNACGPNNLGKCYFEGQVPSGFGTSIVETDPSCSGNFLVHCYFPVGKCGSDAVCDSGKGVCNLTTNVCDNSPKAKCEKAGFARIWVEGGLNKCLLKSDFDVCVKDYKIDCPAEQNINVNLCHKDCLDTLNQDIWDQCQKYKIGGFDAQYNDCAAKLEGGLKYKTCEKSCSNFLMGLTVNEYCNKLYINCINNKEFLIY